MTAFKEQFPSLKDKVSILDFPEHLDFGGDARRLYEERCWNNPSEQMVSVSDIQEHCIDKQRVKDAIDELLREWKYFAGEASGVLLANEIKRRFGL